MVLIDLKLYIRTLNDIITKCLVGTGSYWPLYIAPATFAMNCQVSQITGFSPFQMVYSKPPPDKLAFDFDPTKSGFKVDTRLCCVAPLCLLSLNPFSEFRIWNNSLSSDVLYIQASISISPKYESKSKTTSHCHLLLHDCTNVAV